MRPAVSTAPPSAPGEPAGPPEGTAAAAGCPAAGRWATGAAGPPAAACQGRVRGTRRVHQLKLQAGGACLGGLPSRPTPPAGSPSSASVSLQISEAEPQAQLRSRRHALLAPDALQLKRVLMEDAQLQPHHCARLPSGGRLRLRRPAHGAEGCERACPGRKIRAGQASRHASERGLRSLAERQLSAARSLRGCCMRP